MTPSSWLRLLRRNRFAVSPSRVPRAVGVTASVLSIAFFAQMQRWRFAAAIAAEPIPPPVFIIGHWRSGTTFLHELMGSQRQFIAPTLLECFATEHFLAPGWESILRGMSFMMPTRRPMDDVAVGWDQPQEDEFALMAMGIPSPYEAMAFPNRRWETIRHLHVADWPVPDRDEWRAALTTVMKRVAFARRRKESAPMPRRWMLLKSPTHTARIGLLREMFPEAKFVHIARDPVEIYASTERLWLTMYDSQGLQRPHYQGTMRDRESLAAFILASLPEVYRDFDRDVAAVPPGSWAETRYERLISDPEGEVTRVLRELDLGTPDRTALRDCLAARVGYRRNRHDPDPEIAAAIRVAWSWYFDRFGYPRDQLASAQPGDIAP